MLKFEHKARNHELLREKKRVGFAEQLQSTYIAIITFSSYFANHQLDRYYYQSQQTFILDYVSYSSTDSTPTDIR